MIYSSCTRSRRPRTQFDQRSRFRSRSQQTFCLWPPMTSCLAMATNRATPPPISRASSSRLAATGLGSRFSTSSRTSWRLWTSNLSSWTRSRRRHPSLPRHPRRPRRRRRPRPRRLLLCLPSFRNQRSRARRIWRPSSCSSGRKTSKGFSPRFLGDFKPRPRTTPRLPTLPPGRHPQPQPRPRSYLPRRNTTMSLRLRRLRTAGPGPPGWIAVHVRILEDLAEELERWVRATGLRVLQQWIGVVSFGFLYIRQRWSPHQRQIWFTKLTTHTKTCDCFTFEPQDLLTVLGPSLRKSSGRLWPRGFKQQVEVFSFQHDR
ncbi:hypothetical protein VTK56DRAFT_407 [Thermocarpiscus australiensis]